MLNDVIYGVLIDNVFNVAEVYSIDKNEYEKTLQKALNTTKLLVKKVVIKSAYYEITYSDKSKVTENYFSCLVGKMKNGVLDDPKPLLNGMLWVTKPNRTSLDNLDVMDIMDSLLLLKNKTTDQQELKLIVEQECKYENKY